jgi:hypothetical protein
MWWWLLLLLTPVSASVLHANARAWAQVTSFDAPEEPPLSRAELESVFENVWADLRAACPQLPASGPSRIDVDLDPRLLELPSFSRVLGWASRTERLVGGQWQGMLSTETRVQMMQEYTHLGTLRVAAHPPGGWFRGEGSCESRFRLEDVLLHETLHLLGIASTVRVQEETLKVGMDYAGVCFPGEFDSRIEDSQGVRVVGAGCAFRATEDDKYYVNGTRLHKAAGPFQDGTTLSHAHNLRAVVSPYVYACNPDGALRLTEDDNTLLRAVGVQCLPSGMRLITTPTPPWNSTEGDPSTAQTLLVARAGSERRSGTRSLIASALWTWWFLAR